MVTNNFHISIKYMYGKIILFHNTRSKSNVVIQPTKITNVRYQGRLTDRQLLQRHNDHDQ